MEISYDGMPLKISSLFSFISEFNAPRLSGPRCIESPYVAGGAPTPPPQKALWKDEANMLYSDSSISETVWKDKMHFHLWVKKKIVLFFYICYVTI